MSANSLFRKIAKKLLYPVTSEKSYKYFQAVSKAMDIRQGNWKEPEIDLLKLGLKEGETTLDIGANYGLYAYHMSKAVGKTGKVISFEPVPFTFKSLKIVASLLGFSKNVELINKGCSNENAEITFKMPVQASGAPAAGLSYIGDRNDDRSGKDKQVRWEQTMDVKAKVVKLDDFLTTVDKLALVKIDVEGAELFCLQGAEKIFSEHLPATICEINPWYLEGFGVKTVDLTNFFTSRGYKIFFYETLNGENKLRQVEAESIIEDNYVFLHPNSFERFSSILPEEIN